jgi:hypothetical protein
MSREACSGLGGSELKSERHCRLRDNRLQNVAINLPAGEFRMPELRIPSHMSGEQYITKAALIADRSITVTVYPGTQLILRDYRAEALRRGLSIVQLYNLRHDRDYKLELEVENAVKEKQLANAISMTDFLQRGIPNPTRVRLSHDENLTPQTSGSTAAVANFYAQDPVRAEETLKSTLLADATLTPRLREQIEDYYFAKGFRINEKYAIFWGRKSGEMTGAGPWLDTNEIMLAQMMIVIRSKDPVRKLVLIGDPVNLPHHIDGMVVPRFDIDLVNYWDRGFPGGRNLSAQMFFIRVIRSLNRDAVSIGTNSGILELPHLMGMKTLYLENDHLHKRKGLRWQMLAANYNKTGNPSELTNLETVLTGLRAKKGNVERIGKIETQIQDIKNKKIDILHHIRPGLQRFSTTTSTELWSSRKALFDEVKVWLTKPLVMQKSQSFDHDLFLDLVINAAKADPDEAAPLNAATPAWARYHDARKKWIEIRASRLPFSGSFHKRTEALRTMSAAMRQHGLTNTQQQQFWDTFNYTYLNGRQKMGVNPPDVRAAYRAWLKDTEDVWTYVQSREFAD